MSPTARTRPRSLGRLVALAFLFVGTLAACSAQAQPRHAQPQHAQPRREAGGAGGLSLAAVLAETGLTLDEIVVPHEPDEAVRVELRDANALAVLLDVRVFADAAEARARLAALEPSLSSQGVARAPNVGDAALTDDAHTVIALARHNLVLVLRTVPGGADHSAERLTAIAQAVVRACDASPRSAAPAALPRELVPRELQPGATATIALPPGFVAMRVDVEGPGLARRIDDRHWLLERASASDVRVSAVDALLRVVR